MQNLIITAIVLALITIDANATNNKDEGGAHATSTNSNGNWNTNKIDVDVSNKNYQQQGQLQFQKQSIKDSGNSHNKNSNKAWSKANSNSAATGGSVSGVVAKGYGGNGTSSVSGFNGNGGASTSGSDVSTGAVTMNQNQVHQTPFAYSPGLASSYSQENCANSASLGVSAGFGAIGGGMPIDNEGCNRRRDVAMWAAFGQNRVACERMTQDEGNADAMKKAGLTCASLTKPAATTPVLSQTSIDTRKQWDRIEAQRNEVLGRIR